MQTEIVSNSEETQTSGRMRAVVQERYGPPDSLSVTNIHLPEIDENEVLIEVVAAGVDRGVWHLVTGRPYLVRLAGYGLTRPKTPVPGLDVSGRVVAIGKEVRRFQVGDGVFGIARGAYAEYAAATEEKLAHKPEGLSFEEAAVSAISGFAIFSTMEALSPRRPTTSSSTPLAPNRCTALSMATASLE